MNGIGCNQFPWVDATVRSAKTLTLSFRGLYDRSGCQDFVVSMLLVLVTNPGVDVKPRLCRSLFSGAPSPVNMINKLFTTGRRGVGEPVP